MKSDLWDSVFGGKVATRLNSDQLNLWSFDTQYCILWETGDRNVMASLPVGSKRLERPQFLAV